MFIHAEREYKIMERLKGHQNIVQGIDYIPEFLRSRGYLVMEKIIGECILNIVMENGPISEIRSKNIMR
jgi:serine/threonine protein kinase